MLGRHNVIQFVDQPTPLFREARGDLTTIRGVALTFDQPDVFHAVQQPRDVGHARVQPVPQFIPAQPARLGTTQDAQHVVLRTADAVRFEQLLDRVLQQGKRAYQVEVRFLLQADEWLSLAEFGSQVGYHA